VEVHLLSTAITALSYTRCPHIILIDYGERAHEVVFGPVTEGERTSHYGVALALGRAMHLSGLPTTYAEYRDQVLAGTAQR
jgi:hypothetical protein